MRKLVFVFVLAGLAGYGLLSYHFILFDSSLKILKKTEVRYKNTFVDGRGAKSLQLILEPDLVGAGINDVIGQIEKAVTPAEK